VPVRGFLLVGAVFAAAALHASCATGSDFGDDDAAAVTGSGGGFTGVGSTGTGTKTGTGSGTGTTTGGSTDCREDAAEPNDTCEMAASTDSVSDSTTTPSVITGTLTNADDEDWFSFDTVDVSEAMGNGYHVSIRFSAPAAANDEFSFDIIRGSACAVPDAKHSNLKAYDWCVDGTAMSAGAPIGEGACSSEEGSAPCTDHSRPYLLRVHRDPLYVDPAGSCVEYTLEIKARGGDTCDFGATCDPQISE
jgi:hypothetical protein